jgi:hypothetical protein
VVAVAVVNRLELQHMEILVVLVEAVRYLLDHRLVHPAEAHRDKVLTVVIVTLVLVITALVAVVAPVVLDNLALRQLVAMEA